MRKFFDKILAATGNIKAMERLDVDDHTEAIINDIEAKPFAIAKNNVLYAGPSELGGYYFLQTIVVGQFKVKTKSGAKLLLMGKDLKLDLRSDMDEFESDFSNVSNRYITRIDFQIEESDLELMSTGTLETATLLAKNMDIDFQIVVTESKDEEE